MLQNRFNSPLTSSCGRLFDGFSALLGLNSVATFEGQVVVLVDVGTGCTQQPVTDVRVEVVVNGEIQTSSFERRQVLEGVEERVLRQIMVNRGYQEAITYSFVDPVMQSAVDPDAEALPPDMSAGLPVMSLELVRDGRTYRFFSTITSFGTPLDATVQELRLESLFPSDEATRQVFVA